MNETVWVKIPVGRKEVAPFFLSPVDRANCYLKSIMIFDNFSFILHCLEYVNGNNFLERHFPNLLGYFPNFTRLFSQVLKGYFPIFYWKVKQ